MGQKYAAYDTTGKIIGYYDSIDSPVPTGVNAIPISDQQWQTCLSSPGAFVVVNKALTTNLTPTPVVTPPSLSQQAQAVLSVGADVVSNSTPAVSSTYAINSGAMSKIMATAMYVQMNNKFPGNQETMGLADISGIPHVFPTPALFLTFANALADYVAALDAVVLGTSTTLPIAPITIA